MVVNVSREHPAFIRRVEVGMFWCHNPEDHSLNIYCHENVAVYLNLINFKQHTLDLNRTDDFNRFIIQTF
jgi:hypothetical protein